MVGRVSGWRRQLTGAPPLLMGSLLNQTSVRHEREADCISRGGCRILGRDRYLRLSAFLVTHEHARQNRPFALPILRWRRNVGFPSVPLDRHAERRDQRRDTSLVPGADWRARIWRHNARED